MNEAGELRLFQHFHFRHSQCRSRSIISYATKATLHGDVILNLKYAIVQDMLHKREDNVLQRNQSLHFHANNEIFHIIAL